MSTTINFLEDNDQTSHVMMVDLTLDGNVYYLSNYWKPITYNSNTYTELGSFLSITDLTEDIQTTNGDITLSLSGIPSEQDYLSQVLTTKIKGGEVTITRGWINRDQNVVLENAFPQPFTTSYKGIITNFAIQESLDNYAGEMTNTVSITCASINTLLEKRVSGQRTNPTDRERLFPNDAVFDRVPELYNISFDFGKEYQAGGGGYGRGGGGGGGGNRRDKRDIMER